MSRPDLVAGYVGICTSGLAGIPFPDEVKDMFRAIRAAARDGRIDEAKRIWSQSGWVGPAHEDPAVRDAMAAMLAGYSGWHFVHDDPVVRIAPPAAERLAGLSIPALIVTGARDLAYNEEVAHALAAKIPGACRLPLAGTHMVSMEEPVRVAFAIDQIADRAA